jgi:ankyrin repeat protein
MQLLLDHGATMPGSGDLQGAAKTGDIEAAALALEFGADVNEVLRLDILDDKDLDIIGPPLHVAVEYEPEAMVEFLLRRGARQDLLNGARATAKALAVRKGNPKIIRLL